MSIFATADTLPTDDHTEVFRQDLKILHEDPSTLSIPSPSGFISEAFKGDSGNLIIHIQDAHANLGAQRNLAHILDELISRYGIDLVFVEGGSGNDSLSFLRDYAPTDVRKRVAMRFLEKGEISGEEYLDIVSENNKPFLLWGIEDPALYDRSLLAYAEIIKFRRSADVYLNKISRAVESLKPQLYPRAYLDLERIAVDFRNSKLSLTAYYDILAKESRARAVDPQMFPNFYKLSTLKASEWGVAFALAADEQAQILKKISPNESLFTELSQYVASPNIGNAPPPDWPQKIRSRIARCGIDLAATPHYARYLDYIERFAELDIRELLREVRVLEDMIADSHLSNPAASRLRLISQHLDLLRSYFFLTLRPEEFEFYKKNIKEFRAEDWLGFINRQLIATNRHADAVPLNMILDDKQPEVERFYRTVKKRDYAFVSRAFSKMEETGRRVAVLICGGYHTPHLTRMLRDRETSYIVITPHVNDKTNIKNYERVLLGELDSAKHRPMQVQIGSIRSRAARERPWDDDLIEELSRRSAAVGAKTTSLSADRLQNNTPDFPTGSRLSPAMLVNINDLDDPWTLINTQIIPLWKIQMQPKMGMTPMEYKEDLVGAVDARNQLILLAMIKDRVVGVGRADIHGGVGTLSENYTHPSMQNQGIGRQLFEARLKWLIANKPSAIQLYDASGTPDAEGASGRLALQYGFEKNTNQPNLYVLNARGIARLKSNGVRPHSVAGARLSKKIRRYGQTPKPALPPAPTPDTARVEGIVADVRAIVADLGAKHVKESPSYPIDLTNDGSSRIRADISKASDGGAEVTLRAVRRGHTSKILTRFTMTGAEIHTARADLRAARTLARINRAAAMPIASPTIMPDVIPTALPVKDHVKISVRAYRWIALAVDRTLIHVGVRENIPVSVRIPLEAIEQSAEADPTHVNNGLQLFLSEAALALSKNYGKNVTFTADGINPDLKDRLDLAIGNLREEYASKPRVLAALAKLETQLAGHSPEGAEAVNFYDPAELSENPNRRSAGEVNVPVDFGLRGITQEATKQIGIPPLRAIIRLGIYTAREPRSVQMDPRILGGWQKLYGRSVDLRDTKTLENFFQVLVGLMENPSIINDYAVPPTSRIDLDAALRFFKTMIRMVVESA